MIRAISIGSNTSESDPPASRGERRNEFSAFVALVEPRLRRALAGAVGPDAAPDAVAEALAWAWEHWDRVKDMTNPAGYLYRVARSHSRVRPPRRVRFLVQIAATVPEIEPALPDALHRLPEQQRTVVWLVYACEWSYAETAEAMGISRSAVGTHARRGLAALRASIGEFHD